VGDEARGEQGLGDEARGEQGLGAGGRGEHAAEAGGRGKGCGGLLNPSIFLTGDLGLKPNSLEFPLFKAKTLPFGPGERLLVLAPNISSDNILPREQLVSLVDGSSLCKCCSLTLDTGTSKNF
jgi:hypothetical protein